MGTKDTRRELGGIAPLEAALRDLLQPMIREAVVEAVAELREGERIRPVLLTANQLCEALQISRATLHRLRQDGLPFVRLLDSRRFELDAVLGWLKQRR